MKSERARVGYLVAVFATLLLSANALGATFLRWTFHDMAVADLPSIVMRVNAQTGLRLTPADYVQDEERLLAYSHYQRFPQIVGGVRVKDAAIRIWSRGPAHSRLIQAEANVEDPANVPGPTQRLISRLGALANGLRDVSTELSSATTIALARRAIAGSDDEQMRGVAWRDYLVSGALVREVYVTGRRGEHQVTIDVAAGRVRSVDYRLFPNSDGKLATMNIPTQVFPIYEEFRGQTLDRKPVVLKNIYTAVQRPGQDPFVVLRNGHRYLYSLYDPLRAQTPEGQAQGYWSDALLREQVRAIVEQVPTSENSFGSGLLLQGRYATVNINPEAFARFQGINLSPEFTSHQFYLYQDVEVNGQPDTELIPSATYFGKPRQSLAEITGSTATRDQEHNPVVYINEGFDEIQVYYAIDKMFESLRPRGFRDPELSTRPFHAILFDPDIASRDNAYYTADTINFTTYSPTELNYARDNTTIWHELGHGVMDRLMGDYLNLADTGGLSEGMADFVAELVLQSATGGVDFPGRDEQRIINRTGFYLTNEVHDDGEAYGGVMKDILDRAIGRWGRRIGLTKMADLTMEAMRLARDNPHLTATDWFEYMYFADELGRAGLRVTGELRPLIASALASRNFSADALERGKLSLVYDGNEVTAGSPGSRGHGIRLQLAPTATRDLAIRVKVEDGTNYRFSYPLTLRTYYRTGPLQGAVHWTGEESVYSDTIVNASGEEHEIPLQVSGTCDEINRDDGSCVDFVYVQVINQGETKPVAKKRFYVRVKSTPP